MIRSKYLGREYDNGWYVSAVNIAGRYGKRKKAKGNSYRFTLTRFTSDEKCLKSLVVSHNTMVKIDRGLETVEHLELVKTNVENSFNNSSSYKFLKVGDVND